MRRFTRLYLDLDATNATGEKISLLETYLRDAPAADAAWALALFTGNRPRRAASTRALQTLAIKTANIPPWLFDECYAAVGDLSETIALLVSSQNESEGTDEPLHLLIEECVLPLIGRDDDARSTIIRRAWKRMNADQRFVYHKLIRGGFRIGVQKRLLARALARVAGVDPKTVLQRLVGSVEPTPEAYHQILSGEHPAERALTPLPFYLATPLERPPHTLGPVGDWLVEWKYDGVRSQIVRRRGQIAIWSRGEELITEQFPELVAAARRLPDDAVVDGEILIWEDDRPRPFAELQKRLNRKIAPADQLDLFDTRRVVMIAFDLLELAGEDLRERPQIERRHALCRLLEATEDDTIRVSSLVPSDDWRDVANLRETSRERGVEGLMLKHARARYDVGRVRSDTGWWKWKIDPFSVDAVLVSAQPGSGRRASLYTDYTFALWEAGAETGEARRLVTFAKAYSGLTREEIETLDRWIRAHTTRKSGPYRQVEPDLVFEIAFEDVRASRRHKSGVAVRFPRMLRWRKDKPADEADTIETLRRLIRGDAS